MIEIDGSYHCVIEHTDALIGAQQITDVVLASGDEPTALVFANGRRLPLICPCCAEPLQIDDADQLWESAAGLYLVGLSYLPPEEDEPECLEFIFARTLSDELPEEAQALLLHLDSVRGIK
jgi:hypothetical protein